MRAMVLLLVVAACTDQGEEDGFKLHVAVTASSQFDHLDVYLPSEQLAGPAILTPALLATGTPAPTTATIWRPQYAPKAVELAAATTYTFEQWSLFGRPDHVAMLGQRQAADGTFEFVGFAMTGVIFTFNPGCCDEADVSLPLADVTVAEKWGTYSSQYGGSCLRVVDASSATTYLVNGDDRDCDGIPDDQDCKPDTYCDPSATSGPAHDACACDVAE